jgi:hypothetical protein
MSFSNQQSALLRSPLDSERIASTRHMVSTHFLMESLMPTQQLALIANILNMAKPDWFLFAVASFFLSSVSRGESTWDMTNRICDYYFPETAKQNRPAVSRAA